MTELAQAATMPRAASSESNAGPSLYVRALTRLAAPVDITWLAALRVMFGVMVATSMVRFVMYGWLEQLFLQPRYHFKYYGFSWVEPLPDAWLRGLFWTLALLGLLVALGALYRVTAPLLVLGFTYLQLIDVATYLNHYVLVSLLGVLLVFAPAGRAWSLDVWLWPKLARSYVSSATHALFRFQVGAVYTFAGLAKAQSDWLIHAQPLRIWLGSHTGMPVLGPLFAHEASAIAMSWGGFLFDSSVPWLLLHRRTRPYAYLVLIGFHGLVGELFPIGMFPVIMIVAATVFFEPDWPRRLVGRVFRLTSPPAPAACPPARTTLGIALAYCLLQLVIPLRFLAYGGDVRWHEQGMRFSWRVMVREKNGNLTYLVRSKQTGRTWYIPPSRYLTPVQEREICGQPDLILQLAHHVADDFQKRGYGVVEVRAQAYVSLNGRLGRYLIDPNVDLTAIDDGFAPASWILPSPQDAPPHTRPI